VCLNLLKLIIKKAYIQLSIVEHHLRLNVLLDTGSSVSAEAQED